MDLPIKVKIACFYERILSKNIYSVLTISANILMEGVKLFGSDLIGLINVGI
jgi:hypothetical protein